MELAQEVGQMLELVDEMELYGHEGELVRCLITGDFAGAFTLCHELKCQEYQLLPGVPPGLTSTYRKNLQMLERMKAHLAQLYLHQYTGGRKTAAAV